ncbi:hypothetical protein NDU88_006977 [Pleurodeles waltl]|uniref:Uncharacterized protein n=1 Tax=Pleurodeles waltl TaxID=8319 RepID=A0AAV7PST5_PLEWA|nr:hypothetical protein NDU88_006977 [Pleurodeles waltl]
MAVSFYVSAAARRQSTQILHDQWPRWTPGPLICCGDHGRRWTRLHRSGQLLDQCGVPILSACVTKRWRAPREAGWSRGHLVEGAELGPSTEALDSAAWARALLWQAGAIGRKPGRHHCSAGKEVKRGAAGQGRLHSWTWPRQ